MISAFFTADYRDGRVVFVGKSYPAGVFATHLLNQFYINDTAARIYADRKGDFFFATAGEWIVHNTGRKHIPRYMFVSL